MYRTFELLDTFESQDIPFVWGTVSNLAAASEPDELDCLKTEDPCAWAWAWAWVFEYCMTVCLYGCQYNIIPIMHSFIPS